MHCLCTHKVDYCELITIPLGHWVSHEVNDKNTFVFMLDFKANRKQNRQTVQRLCDIDVVKVNTLITPEGGKKAYVQLACDYVALDVANKIEII